MICVKNKEDSPYFVVADDALIQDIVLCHLNFHHDDLEFVAYVDLDFEAFVFGLAPSFVDVAVAAGAVVVVVVVVAADFANVAVCLNVVHCYGDFEQHF